LPRGIANKRSWRFDRSQRRAGRAPEKLENVPSVPRFQEQFASPTVRDNLRNPDAADAYEDSLDAAINAGNEPNGTNGATHIYLNAGQTTKPDWYNQGEIQESFGPFVVANRTREFSAGEEIDIEIIVSPAPKPKP
jgi:hypothetical protein